MRVGTTGIAFAAAGTLSLLFALTAVPLLRWSSRGAEEGELRAQRGVHWCARFFMGALRAMRLLDVDVAGGERLRAPGTLVVANHPTLLDAIALMSLMPQADCVVKERYYQRGFLAGSARGAGYIPNRDGPGVVAECVERLLRGRSVIIFPEGTRSPVHELGPFARGAAHIALRAICDPLPVTIECEPATLYRGQAWWEVPDRTPTLTLRVGEPLAVEDAVPEGMTRGRSARVLTARLREHFERQLAVV